MNGNTDKDRVISIISEIPFIESFDVDSDSINVHIEDDKDREDAGQEIDHALVESGERVTVRKHPDDNNKLVLSIN